MYVCIDVVCLLLFTPRNAVMGCDSLTQFFHYSEKFFFVLGTSDSIFCCCFKCKCVFFSDRSMFCCRQRRVTSCCVTCCMSSTKRKIFGLGKCCCSIATFLLLKARISYILHVRVCVSMHFLPVFVLKTRHFWFTFKEA